jgi:hypothetical protein
MKISKARLRQIIQEELEYLKQEQDKSAAKPEARMHLDLELAKNPYTINREAYDALKAGIIDENDYAQITNATGNYIKQGPGRDDLYKDRFFMETDFLNTKIKEADKNKKDVFLSRQRTRSKPTRMLHDPEAQAAAKRAVAASITKTSDKAQAAGLPPARPSAYASGRDL